MECCLGGFTLLVGMSLAVKWQPRDVCVFILVNRSVSLSSRFSRNALRLVGRNIFASLWLRVPSLGIELHIKLANLNISVCMPGIYSEYVY